MGEPAKAEPAQIVDIPYLRDPAWRGVPDYMHYRANYLLIVDNLSDFVHLAFVHTKTLGGSEEYAFKTRPVAIERLERGFRVERWHMNAPPPPFHRKVVRGDAPIDRRNIARMYAPGVFFMETLFSPAGSGAEKGNMQGARQYRNCQFFTPETRRSTHFFWDYLHDYDLHDPTIALSLNKSMIEGFLEDKFIIEGQQETLDADPDFKMNAIVADAPLAHFRRTLAKLIDAERGSRSRPRRDEFGVRVAIADSWPVRLARGYFRRRRCRRSRFYRGRVLLRPTQSPIVGAAGLLVRPGMVSPLCPYGGCSVVGMA
jgi:vanillate O-demethylase monooxygenase subunit